MKHKLAVFWCVVFGGLFALLQTGFQYHFYYIEQSQLFLFSRFYIADKLWTPGGFAQLVSEFLIQFFVVPYAGPAIVAALLTAVGIGTAAIVRRMTSVRGLFLLYLLPVFALLFMQFNFNYRTQGTIAYLLVLAALDGYMHIRNMKYRLATGIVAVPVLFGLTGSAAVLFALAACLFEACNSRKGGLLSLFMPAEALLSGWAAVHFACIGEYRLAFTPEMYYHYSLHPKIVIYYSWICLLLIVLVAGLLKGRKKLFDKRLSNIICYSVQVVAAGLIAGFGISEYNDAKNSRIKKLDYYARTEQWDKTIEECKGKLTNYLYMCHLNMALVNRGELAERMFDFDQRSSMGLVAQWNKSENISCLLSDIYFAMGATALAQEMAFEGYVCARDGGNPRMLKRLVQTNLIYGAYHVAKKYIVLLEHTFGYRRWAASQRRFLYDDSAVEADQVLGTRRRMLPAHNTLSLINGLDSDLENILQNAPANSAAIQYLGALFLLSKDMEHFKRLLYKYYGTEVLPVLPRSFQEAVIVLSEKEPDYWKRFNIEPGVIARFAGYKKQLLTNRGKKSLPALMARSYGNTYWFYFMFK